MPKFQESITNEEVNGLPVGAFSGEIVVVDTPAAFEEACAYLATQPLIGFDTETRPSFSKGVTTKSPCCSSPRANAHSCSASTKSPLKNRCSGSWNHRP